jgi:hypothetical protein
VTNQAVRVPLYPVGSWNIATYSGTYVPLTCGYPTRCLGAAGYALDSAAARLRGKEKARRADRAGLAADRGLVPSSRTMAGSRSARWSGRAPGITGKPVRLAERPPLLVGPEDLLAELDARPAGGDGSRPRMVALTGFGGTGKTSLALATGTSS